MLSMRAVLFCVLSSLCVERPAAQKPPTRKQCEQAIRDYIHGQAPGVDRTNPDAGRTEIALRKLLAATPAVRARDVKAWRKRIAKVHKRGRRLETSGRHWFDEKGKRGLYFVGGETQRPRGLLIGLHGGGVGSGDASSSYGAYQSAAKKLKLALVCPEVLVKSELGWTTDGTEEWVMDLVDCALRTWRIDPDHVYITGHSMGGYGSWTLGAHHADRFAGAAPSAGAPTPIFDANQRDRIIDMQEGVIPSLRNLRLVVFQSTDDPRVPPGPNQHAVKLLGEAKQRWEGFDYEYLEVDDRGHGFPRGGPIVLLEKIITATRNAVPERITWQPAVPWKRQFYWLWWEAPQIGVVLDATIDRANNRIDIAATRDGKNVEAKGIRVLLDERIVDLDREVLVMVNGLTRFEGKVERRLEVMAMTGVHPDAALSFVAIAPPLDAP